MGNIENDIFSKGFLSVDQAEFNISSVEFEQHDLILGFSSWEPRATAICGTGPVVANTAKIFSFNPPDADNGRMKNAQTLKTYFAKTSHAEIVVLGRSTDFDVNIKVINAEIIEFIKAQERQIDVLIDITTCPKIYFMSLIGWLLKTGLARKITVFYGQADYEVSSSEPSKDSDRKLNLTLGDWSAATVPYLEGYFNAGQQRHLLVSMGSEALSVEKFVRRYEPDKITLLYPFPGLNHSLDEGAKKEAKIAGKNLGLSKSELVSVRALDCVQFARKLTLLTEKTHADVDFSMLALGTKPHALALSLVGVTNEALQVVCRIPKSYIENMNCSNGKANVYRIRDLSIPQ